MKRSTIYLSTITIVTALLGLGLWLVYRAFKASRKDEPYAFILKLSEDQSAGTLKDLFGKSILEKGGSYIYRTAVIDQNGTYSLRISLPIVSEGEKS